MKYFENIINCGIFRDLKKSEYVEAFETLAVSGRKFRKGNHVYMEDDVIDKLCIVRSGSLRGEKTYSDGDVHIVSVFEENDIFALEIALSKKKVSAIGYICNEDTEVIYVSLNSIEKSRYGSRINRTLTHMLADENIRMSHKVEILAERSLRERIMVYLRVLQRKSGTDTVTVKMNREQLAQFLCVNRSALSNELNKMKREGILDFKGSKFVIKQ